MLTCWLLVALMLFTMFTILQFGWLERRYYVQVWIIKHIVRWEEKFLDHQNNFRPTAQVWHVYYNSRTQVEFGLWAPTSNTNTSVPVDVFTLEILGNNKQLSFASKSEPAGAHWGGVGPEKTGSDTEAEQHWQSRGRHGKSLNIDRQNGRVRLVDGGGEWGMSHVNSSATWVDSQN